MKRFRRWALAMASLAVLSLVFAASAVAAKAPTPVYTEDFENTGNAALLLTDYQGTAAAQNETYTAASGWLRDCNGWVMTGTSPVPVDTRNCSASYWPTMRNLITSMGTLQGQATPTANHGLAGYTFSCGDPTSPSFNKTVVCGGADQVQWETKSPIEVSPNHFYNFAVDAAYTNCHAAHPLFNFSMVAGATEIPLSSIDGCAKGNGAATFSPSAPILVSASSIGLRLRNGQGSANGNDGAVDNIRLLDVTPTMSKAFSPANLHAGAASTLTFTIENTTDLAAKNGWSFKDDLPAGLAVADPANASTTCPTGSVTAAAGETSVAAGGNLNAGQASCTVSVNVTSPTGGTFENCPANVTTVGLEPPPCASVHFEEANLSMEKTVSAEAAASGDQITYTLVVENDGPAAADPAVLKDTLPPGVTYVSNDAGCDVAALPVVECELGTLLSGESRTVQIVAEIQPSAAGTLQTNVARVSAPQPDSDSDDDESSAATAVEPFADLAIDKSVSPELASGPGAEVTYTLEVENFGENESIATVTDTLPAGIGYVSDDGGCDTSALPTITCDLGTLAKGDGRAVHVVAEVEASAAGKEVENTAAVSGSIFDPDSTNDEASATLEVEPRSDLAITKTKVGAATAKPGETITYLLTAENKGPTTEPSVTVTDTLPSNLEYVSDDGACDTSALPEISCAIGVQEEGKSNTITLKAKVLATSGTVANVAEVSGINPDPDPGNNSSTAETTIEPVSDLAIDKTASAPIVRPGEQLTYTLEVENKGLSTSNPTTVTDTLPTGLTYVSDDGGCETAGLPELVCSLGSMASGASKTIHVVAEVAPSATGSLQNTAVVSGPNEDPEPADNESSATTTVEEIADLTISKSASAPAVEPGDQLTYTLEVENKGPSTSNPTTVTDTLPAGVGYVSNDSGCDVSALPTVSCDLGSLASGATKTIQIVTEVSATAGSLENTAEVEGPLADPEPADNEDSATTTVEELSDLAIEKTASAPFVKPGEQLTYTLEVENKGPSASDPTTVTDTLPAELTYVSDDAGCDVSALPQISCDLGAVAGSATATIEIVAEVAGSASGTVVNAAEVEGPNPDSTPADNEATATTWVVPLAADLALSKSAPGTAVKTGDQITYTLVASNQGPDPSPETVVTDTLPAQLTYVSDDAGCDTSSLPEIECELGTVADGESQTIHIVTEVAFTDGQPIENEARVSGAHPDPNPTDNPDAAQVPLAPVSSPQPPAPPVTPAPPARSPISPKPPRLPKAKGTPRLTLTKTTSARKARPGSVISYRITVANTGDGAARKVVVCDHPPAEQRTLRTEPKAASKTKPCWHLRKLAAGAKRTFTLTAMVDPGSDRGAQRNRATATAANVKGVRADTAAVRVKPLPDSGCLARPLGGGLPAEIEFLC